MEAKGKVNIAFQPGNEPVIKYPDAECTPYVRQTENTYKSLSPITPHETQAQPQESTDYETPYVRQTENTDASISLTTPHETQAQPQESTNYETPYVRQTENTDASISPTTPRVTEAQPQESKPMRRTKLVLVLCCIFLVAIFSVVTVILLMVLPKGTTTRDCSDILALTANGIYQINPEMIPVAPSSVETHPITVYCDMETDGGGWIVFQRRFIGAVGFDRDWSDYKRGFGYVNGDYWLGLQSIHLITSLARYEFRVDLEDFEGNHVYATYNRFHLEGEESNYKIYLGTYAGTAGDSMAHTHGKDFSTKDRDHDTHSSNCAQVRKGGWWYESCAWANLNSPYLGPSHDTSSGMSWYHWRNNFEVLAKSEMKIRRID